MSFLRMRTLAWHVSWGLLMMMDIRMIVMSMIMMCVLMMMFMMGRRRGG